MVDAPSGSLALPLSKLSKILQTTLKNHLSRVKLLSPGAIGASVYAKSSPPPLLSKSPKMLEKNIEKIPKSGKIDSRGKGGGNRSQLDRAEKGYLYTFRAWSF